MTAELRTIHYVEDDEDIAEIAVMTLQELGNFDVTHCSSGQSAIEAYDRVAPQIVLMDVMMPLMDGPETMTRLLRSYGSRCAPVIFMTAKAQAHEQAAYREMGALEVILKPFNPMTLCNDINEIWRLKHAA